MPTKNPKDDGVPLEQNIVLQTQHEEHYYLRIPKILINKNDV